MSTRTFAEMDLSSRGKQGICRRCDGAKKTAGQVSVVLHALGPSKQTDGGHRVGSRNVSLCESCSIEVYELVRDLLVEEAKA
jgi:hypothetical protein